MSGKEYNSTLQWLENVQETLGAQAPTSSGTGEAQNVNTETSIHHSQNEFRYENIDPALRAMGPASGVAGNEISASAGFATGAAGGQPVGAIAGGQDAAAQPRYFEAGEQSNINRALGAAEHFPAAAENQSGAAAGATNNGQGHPLSGGDGATGGNNVQAAASGEPGNAGSSGNEKEDQYDTPRARSEIQHDVTAFFEPHRHWSLQNLPDILYQWKKADHKNPNYEPEDRIDPKTGQPMKDPKTGRVLKIFRNIPATLSSQVEGWLMEAMMREDDRITYRDLLAYIPDTQKKPAGLNTLQMRVTRFRDQYRLCSWSARSSNHWWESRLEKDLTDDQKARNTTRGLPPFTNTRYNELKAQQAREKKAEEAGSVPAKRKASVKEDEENSIDENGRQKQRAKRHRTDANEHVTESREQPESSTGGITRKRGERGGSQAPGAVPRNEGVVENNSGAEAQSQAFSAPTQAGMENLPNELEREELRGSPQPNPGSHSEMMHPQKSSHRHSRGRSPLPREAEEVEGNQAEANEIKQETNEENEVEVEGVPEEQGVEQEVEVDLGPRVRQCIRQYAEQYAMQYAKQYFEHYVEIYLKPTVEHTIREVIGAYFQPAMEQNIQESIQQSIQQSVQQAIQQNVQQGIQQGPPQAIQEGVQQPVQPEIQQDIQPEVRQDIQPGNQRDVQQTIQQGTQQNLQTTAQPNVQPSLQQALQHAFQGTIQQPVPPFPDDTDVALETIDGNVDAWDSSTALVPGRSNRRTTAPTTALTSTDPYMGADSDPHMGADSDLHIGADSDPLGWNYEEAMAWLDQYNPPGV